MQWAESAGVTLHPLDTGQISNATAIGFLSAGQFGLFAEFHARQSGEKSAMRKQISLDNGIPPFPNVTIAYQRREDGTLEPHETNAPLVREAIAMRLRGVSVVKITKWLNESGVVDSKTGEPKRLNPQHVIALFRSRLLVGEMHFGTFTPNLHAIDEPILDHETFERLQKMTSSKGRHAKSERLLARLGIVECATCHSRMSVRTSRARTGVEHFYYRCADPICESPAGVNALEIEALVLEKTKQEAAGLVGTASLDRELEDARVAREAAEEKLDNAVLSFVGIDSPKTREVLLELQSTRDAAISEHERLLALSAPALTVSPDDLESAPLEIKRELIVSLIDRVVVRRGREPVVERVVVKAKSASK
jgi:hypothetical protein